MDKNAIILAVATLLLGGVISWFASRLYGNRRTLLHISYSSSESRIPWKGIQYSLDGESVSHPAVRTFWIKNLGPSDIGPNSFDGGHLHIRVGGRILAVRIDDRVASGDDRISIKASEVISINPQVIPHGKEIMIQALVDLEANKRGSRTQSPSVSLTMQNVSASTKGVENYLFDALFGPIFSLVGHALSLSLVFAVAISIFWPGWSPDFAIPTLIIALLIGVFATRYGFMHGESIRKPAARSTLPRSPGFSGFSGLWD
ncbi:hypothetical protein [Rhodococcus sp. SJ-3]|uniref:hypothetical protein n=1 Tax=Rhodococcus sp. SJ-3 TaxID=3454628 RepID=UPI003F7B01CD